MRRISTLLSILLAVTLGQHVLEACGDKFFLVGNGSRFNQAFASLNPGNVLIYTGGGTEISKGLRDARLHKYIKDAGHRIVIAADRGELETALAAGAVDVVLAGLGQASDLVPPVASAASKPTLLPIEGKGPDATSSHQFARRLKSSDKIIRFLSGIEDAMKSRKAAARTGRG